MLSDCVKRAKITFYIVILALLLFLLLNFVLCALLKYHFITLLIFPIISLSLLEICHPEKA